MKVKRILLVAALLIFAVALALQFRHSPEPIYQGRSLTQWLKQSEADNSATNHEICDQAIRAIGTNGIPTLLKLLDTKETPGFYKIQELVYGLGIKSIHTFDPSYKPRLGNIGFWALGEAGKPAQAKLGELSQPGHSSMTQASALWCLEGIKVDKEFLVPLLIQNSTNADLKVSMYAAKRLYYLAPEMKTNAVGTKTNEQKK